MTGTWNTRPERQSRGAGAHPQYGFYVPIMASRPTRRTPHCCLRHNGAGPHQFQVRKGRALFSTHVNFRDAEDAALHYWLGPKPKGHDDDARASRRLIITCLASTVAK
jgi:hypothetical protein